MRFLANDIITATADKYQFRVQELKQLSRRKDIVKARHIAMYLCRALTDLSYPELGRLFERHHTTVIHAVDKIRVAVRKDGDLSEEVATIMQHIEKGT